MGGSDTSGSSDDEDVTTLSCLRMQTGRVDVGTQDEGCGESKRVDVSFEKPFQGTPIVVVCAEGQKDTDYPDCFGCTVVNPSSEGFSVNVGRQHRECRSWGQEVQLNFLAVETDHTELLQSGVEEAGAKEEGGEESVEVRIKFKPAFPAGSTPSVICTAYGEDYPDCFSCTLRRVTRKHAFVRVARSSSEHYHWGQTVKVNWVATTLFPCGNLEIGAQDNEECGEVAYPDQAFPGKYKKRPTVFVTTQHESGSEYPDSFAMCASNVQKESFQINIARIHPEAQHWGMNLRASYIVIP